MSPTNQEKENAYLEAMVQKEARKPMTAFAPFAEKVLT